jgi:hypothetical protein
MIAVLGWNVYTILDVGVDRASTSQWIITGIMGFFVAYRLIQFARGSDKDWPGSD